MYEYLPQVVNRPNDPDNTWAVEYEHIVPYLIKGMQEQQAQIQSIQSAGNIQGNLTGNIEVPTLFVQDTSFQGNISVFGHMALGADSVGRAQISAGEQSVRVVFDQVYLNEPVVTISLRGSDGLSEVFHYSVTEESRSGFTISLSQSLGRTVEFNWHAFEVSGDIKISTNKSESIFVESPPVEPFLEEEDVVTDDGGEEEIVVVVPDAEDTSASMAPEDVEIIVSVNST